MQREVVRIQLDPSAPTRCGFFLVARGRREWAVRVPGLWSSREPYVALAVRIVPGRDAILVVRGHGASTVFGSLCAVVGTRLAELRFPNPWTSVVLYGSVGHYSMFDCAGPSRIVASGMGYLEGRRPYAVEQTVCTSSAVAASSDSTTGRRDSPRRRSGAGRGTGSTAGRSAPARRRGATSHSPDRRARRTLNSPKGVCPGTDTGVRVVRFAQVRVGRF